MQATSEVGRTMRNGVGVNGNWESCATPSTRLETPQGPDSDFTSGRASKRHHKTGTNQAISSRPAEPTPISGIRPDLFPPPASRRRQSSFRDQRVTQSLASLQSSTSKRLDHIGNTNSQNTLQDFNPNSSRDAHQRDPSINDLAGVNFAPPTSNAKQDASQSSSSFDFLPSASFDDLHASIGSGGPDVNSSPQPGQTSRKTEVTSNGSMFMAHRPGLGATSKTIDASELGSRITLNGSSIRRQNSNAQARVPPRNDVETVVPSNIQSSARIRRKSYFPAPNAGPGDSAAAPTMRAPRKSVGPGILPMNIEGTSHPHRRTALAQAGLGSAATSVDSKNAAGRRNISSTQDSSFELTSRHNKTKSLQPPPRKILVPEQFFTPSGTPEQNLASPSSTARSPGRPNLQGTTTPSSSKRMSVMPGSTHATGLGARTISPTDARRLKRMSMMPVPPPMPFTPPTPQPDAPFSAGRPAAPSPSMIPRKSVTPSSSRTTPDPNPSSSALRISQSLSSSRLPTPKTRNDNAPSGEEEMVPPVPAIPKAYESPKSEYDHAPFFETRKSSLSQETSSLKSTSNIEDIPSPIEAEPPRLDRQARQNRYHHPGGEPATGKKPSGGPMTANKRTLQPLRLPPLNLLPLSTPTASKIAALHDSSATINKGAVTPPPKPQPKGTPTTPMTASKANFSRNYYEDGTAPMPATIRSSSSHYNIRPEALSYRAASSSSTAVPVPESPALTASRTAMSPFISSSVPKSSGEFGYTRLEKSNTFDLGADTRSTILTGPRLQKPRKVSKDDASSMEITGSMDISAHSIGNSIRRKLSITRKRSTSKAQTPVDREMEPPPKPPKHEMPPPKLPASATWNGPLLASPTPSQQSSQGRSTRNVSNPSTKAQHHRVRSSTWDTMEIPKKEPRPPETAIAGTKRTARANFEGTPSQNSLSLKDFLREAKTMELTLDRDDLSAEDEMKKLALKRRETEIAAKEVDALRRRATAKERVSPTAALRMAQLNIFERGEIVDYKDVYFCGTQDAKKHVGDLTTEVANFGYDDDRGDYNIVKGDHLAFRYEIVDILGKGSFGQVARCIDHKTGVLVAIKIIRNKKRFHQQALVEVEILQKLRDWDPANKHSMVNFVQSFYFRSHLCISTELLGMNLYEFIKCHDFRGFSLKLIRRFAKQLISSLVLLKSHKVIHCDLKPENVLLAHPTRSEIKVIDFGSSCLENEKVYTYIQSRFYRSPEVILGMTYGMPIDMWSLGCILAELLTGYPIFPGENEQEQLACIMEVFGPPEKHLIEKSTRKKLFFDSLGKPRITVSTKGKRRRPSSKSLQQALKCEDEAFLDFITRCLRWDPDRRLKPDDAVHHEFIAGKAAKSNARSRITTSNLTSSPIKRYNSISQTSATTRPLPDPPTTNAKPGTGMRVRDITASSGSPIKAGATPAGPKRHSTITAIQTNGTNSSASATAGAGVKRTLNGATVQGSALPRVTSTPRVGTGGGKGVDLAAAAAMASLKTK